MKSLRTNSLLLISLGIVAGFLISQILTFPTDAGQDVLEETGTIPSLHGTAPVYEYAYGWGILETEGDAIYLSIPELETTDSDWGEIEVYKTIEFNIAFEGGATGTEMYAINQIAEMGWELVTKYYITDGYEKGHHYWFRRVKR